MKKLIVIFMAVAMLCVTACGGKKGNEGDMKEMLQRMETANSNEALMKNNDRVAYQIIYYYADGSEESSYIYMDHDRFAWEGPWGVVIDEKGEVYGFDDIEKMAYRHLFMEDTYEEFKQANEWLVLYAYGEKEVVISSEEKEGVLYMQTEYPEVELYATDIEYSEYDVNDVEKIYLEYEVNPDTAEMLRMKWGICTKDGERFPVFETVRQLDCEKYEPDGQLVECVFGTDSRTVTLIADAGTAEEKVYTQTVTKGSSVMVIFNPAFEQALYLDAECTQLYEGGTDNTEDATYYVKRVK